MKAICPKIMSTNVLGAHGYCLLLCLCSKICRICVCMCDCRRDERVEHKASLYMQYAVLAMTDTGLLSKKLNSSHRSVKKSSKFDRL